MFIRSYDGTLVNLDHFSRILTVPRFKDSTDVIAKSPHGDFVNLAVGLTKEQADDYMHTLETLLDARDVEIVAQNLALLAEMRAEAVSA